MATSLLSHRINTLLLNANASFPSQAQDSRQLIKDWRHECRTKLRLVRPERDADDRGSAGTRTLAVVRGEES